MKYEIQIPSKTFLLGEYAILSGSPATLVTTAPFFNLHVKDGDGVASGFHPESAAGMFIREHRPLFAKLDIEFSDPHTGKGGFGASSAQYLAVWALKATLQNSVFDLEKAFADFKKMLALKNDRSSGADFLSQAVGGVPVLQVDPVAVLPSSWPFRDLSFAIFRTGVKVNTHEHLAQNEISPQPELAEISVASLAAFKEGKSVEWLSHVQRYAKVLKDQNLIAGTTRTLLSRFESIPGIRFAKGSGSLGADTVVVYMNPADKETVIGDIRALGLECVSTESDISSGVVVKNFVFGAAKL